MSEEIFKVIIAGCTDTGLRRNHNEDHIGFNQDLGIAVLADGMGGHQAGEIASHMAVESVLENLQSVADGENSRSITGSQLLEYVSNTISYSNSKIFQAAEALDEHKGMGTTLVAAIVQGSQIYAGHVGDSRLYLFRDTSLKRITKDHSLVQDLVDRGFYTEEEARMASVGHIVTRALGTKAEVEVDTIQHDLADGDLLLLCSDGLSDMVADWLIEETLRERGAELAKTASKLIELANRNGGKDNISVILVQVQEVST
ncbi:MAG: Stp1/IreP family PP2C-type Ser/Thr phosphatase [Gammaproteobacteria bacterium]|nr:Stp1/IreP family PP2C-type Ser/Thr phosphatase [Gammaproteobacteria bacterium]MDD9960014.1 Stp1/IreP family PP2C-type Ser/Thr phosphatase [Gammaproteobacteria bacterium]